MKRLRKLLKNKLKSQNGETLSEVLVAVLVSTLGLTLLAGMITHSVSIIQSSKNNFNVYVEEENKLVEQLAGKSGNIYIDNILLANDYRSTDKPEFRSKIGVTYFTNIVNGEDAENAKVIYTYKAN